MKIGVLGTGMVGEAIATKLVQLGHNVTMGSRTPDNPNAARWTQKLGVNASQGTFSDAAGLSELVFLCTKGEKTLDVIRSVGVSALQDKVVVDVSNPLDLSEGTPPSLLICNTDSLGEQVQKALPSAKVVKTLNIVNCEVMVDPTIAGDPTMLMSGNDLRAKATVATLLRGFGWKDIIDLGDIKTARGTEMLLPVWLSLLNVTGDSHFGFKIVGRRTPDKPLS